MYVNRRDITVEWGDCDPAGIVFFPNYLRYFDAATNTLFLSALGLNKYEMIQKFGIVGIPLVDVGARFFIPSVFGEVVTVESTVAELGRSSFRVQHRLLKGDAVAVEGFEVRVWTGRDPDNPEKLRSRPIPPEVIARLRGEG